MAKTIASKVSLNDSIWIQNWNYIEDALFKKSLSLLSPRKDKFEKAIQDKARSHFPRMHSRADEDSLNK